MLIWYVSLLEICDIFTQQYKSKLMQTQLSQGINMHEGGFDNVVSTVKWQWDGIRLILLSVIEKCEPVKKNQIIK